MVRRLVTSIVVLTMLVVACGGGDDGPAAETAASEATTSQATTSTPTTTTVAATEPTVCGQPLATGFAQIPCEDMTFDVALPERCLSESCGLIVDVHGKGMDAAWSERHTGLQGLGNAAGYVVVQPSSPGLGWDYAVDSVRIRSFLDQLIAALAIDTNRVHIGGGSQGGFMSWVFVCDHAELIASAAPLAAGADRGSDMSCPFDTERSPAQEVDVLLVHGRNDRMVPFDTALEQRDLVVAAWSMTETEILADEPGYRWTRWTSPTGTVFEFLEYDWKGGALGGHCVPGATAAYGCGADTPVHYGEAALEFYIAHPKDE